MKPGAKTTEFVVTAATLLALLIGTVQGALPAENAGVISGALAIVYTFARTFAKTYGNK